MQGKTAVLLGSTGLTGSKLLQMLLDSDEYSRVNILVRKPLAITHPKLDMHITDFSNADNYYNALGAGDIIFCCIGTTMKKVNGNKTLYRTIDHDIPVNAAKWGIEKGFSHYSFVSAIGADSKSSNFYLRLKGEAEDKIRSAGYKSVDIFRPSLLLGDRREERGGERTAQILFPVISFLFAGGWRKYKPVQAEAVARAMLKASLADNSGTTIYEYDRIKALNA
jgi:uncharacterized protein YbjT (DUF2867 family)